MSHGTRSDNQEDRRQDIPHDVQQHRRTSVLALLSWGWPLARLDRGCLVRPYPPASPPCVHGTGVCLLPEDAAYQILMRSSKTDTGGRPDGVRGPQRARPSNALAGDGLGKLWRPGVDVAHDRRNIDIWSPTIQAQPRKIHVCWTMDIPTWKKSLINLLTA